MANEPTKQPKKKSVLARMTSFGGSKQITRMAAEETKAEQDLEVSATPAITEAEAEAIGQDFANKCIAEAEEKLEDEAKAAAAAAEEVTKEAEAAKLKEWQEAELARKNKSSNLLPAALLVGLVALAVYAAIEMQDATIVPEPPAPRGPFAGMFGGK